MRRVSLKLSQVSILWPFTTIEAKLVCHRLILNLILPYSRLITIERFKTTHGAFFGIYQITIIFIYLFHFLYGFFFSFLFHYKNKFQQIKDDKTNTFVFFSFFFLFSIIPPSTLGEMILSQALKRLMRLKDLSSSGLGWGGVGVVY